MKSALFHKTFSAAIGLAGAGEELQPIIPVNFILGGKEFVGPAGQQHFLQFYRGFIGAFNLSREVNGQQDDRIDIVGLGFSRYEAAVELPTKRSARGKTRMQSFSFTWHRAAALIAGAGLAGLVVLSQLRADPGPSILPEPSNTPLSADEELATFKLPAGFRMELVAGDPLIVDPVALSWDGNGRMYVCQMRAYMQDLKDSRAMEKIGRVTRLEDTHDDGHFDKSTVYLDHLFMPRAMLTLDERVLVAEPPDIYLCRDSKGDGVADVKQPIYSPYGGTSPNPEHYANGLMWGLNNWIYNSECNVKFRFKDGKLEEAKTSGGGQWGMTQDDEGRIYLSSNSDPLEEHQIPTEYWKRYGGTADVNAWYHPNRYLNHFGEVLAPVATLDVQSGPGILRTDGTLSSFTAACGQTIFRGDALPAEFYGNYFVCEPVGRIVRRGIIEEHGGMRSVRNPYEQARTEFITSTDGNFRPVNTYTGPDGGLYIVDMYHGIIQHGIYITPYLKEQIQRKAYEKNIGHGRIWRVVNDSMKPGPQPHMLDETPAQLIAHLDHPNGWWRDTAQRLIILRGDKSVVPALQTMALHGKSPLGRLHSLWTLEGLDSLDQPTLFGALSDPDPRVRAGAVRASEPLIREKENAAVLAALAPLVNDPDVDVASQLILSLGETKSPAAHEQMARTALAHLEAERTVYATMLSAQDDELALLGRVMQSSLFVEAGKPNSPLYDSAKRWMEALSFGVITRGKPEEVERLLDIAAAAPDWQRVELVRALVNALPRAQRENERVVNMVRFDKEPEALKTLQRFPDQELKKQLKQAVAWFTWPGEARFDLKSTVVPLSGDDLVRFEHGREIYNGLCFSCHQPDGGGRANEAPPLAGAKLVNARPEKMLHVLLHGMVGPVEGKNYPGVMLPQRPNDDEWIAAVATYVRRAWGNYGSVVRPQDVKDARKLLASGEVPYAESGTVSPEDLERMRGLATPAIGQLVLLQADAANGHVVFAKTCVACHRIGKEGTDFGPDLSQVGGRLPREKIFESILDPNAEIAKGFEGVAVEKRDGDVLTGIIVKQNNDEVILKQAGGIIGKVPSREVGRIVKLKGSFMPTGLQQGMKQQELLDLVAYLSSLK